MPCIPTICAHCEGTFLKNAGRYNATEKKGNKHFCSRACMVAGRTLRVARPCSECGHPVFRTPTNINRNKSGRVFCNGSCAASFNNRAKPKRTKRRGCCQECGAETTTRWRRLCDECKAARGIGRLSLKELRRKLGSNSGARRSIAGHARKHFLKANPNPSCIECGYSTHVEAAHRKDVADFGETSLVSEINALSNLVGLCRNHHWEFDHGLLDLPPRK